MNGWRNRSTWLTSLWFGDGWETENDVDSTREFIEEEFEKLPNWIQDFISDDVDWLEIKASLPVETETETA